MNARRRSPGVKTLLLAVAYTKTTCGFGYSNPKAISRPNCSSKHTLLSGKYLRGSAFTHDRSGPGLKHNAYGLYSFRGELRRHNARPRRWRTQLPLGRYRYPVRLRVSTQNPSEGTERDHYDSRSFLPLPTLTTI